ncbi:SurA N-terminal domain-containing protein [Alkalihalobacillus sp. AL-G]|uniref:SurA N-terminal domain-containing protein n=1 Tax=Alkalihalobacillus sp. AL-G TaxID=2926399 RepID=UPI00272ADAA7|nr:SurA N-terminal domain-containing protein [Alkalihalobacillus sp. AL-G]WLD93622.1 SurA N-terminal domain-containing protein [Alkalihalobacillus sp. AL-G]
MKKLMKFALVALLTVVLAACNGDEKGNKDKEETAPKEEKNTQVDEKKLEEQQIKEDKVIALVNGTELKGADYNRALSQIQLQYQQMGQDPTTEKAENQIKDQILKTLIDFTVVLQDAEKKGYKASGEAVEKELTAIKKNFDNDDKKFEEALKKNNMTEDELKAQLAKNLTYKTYMEKEIKIEDVSEKEMKDYYNKFKEQTKGKEPPPYEDVKGQIKIQLESQKKQKKMTEKIKQLKEDAEIAVLI